MPHLATIIEGSSGEPTDAQLVGRIVDGDPACFELLMRRHNRGLFRIARAIVADQAEAEDVLQNSYLRAYSNLHRFEGRSALRTWLVRIVVNEARARLRKRHRDLVLVDDQDVLATQAEQRRGSAPEVPEQTASRHQIRTLLEREIDALPDKHRSVFVLRDVEGQSTEETAEQLRISIPNVRVRLHRARAILRENIKAQLGSVTAHLYDFGGDQCDRVVEAVLAAI